MKSSTIAWVAAIIIVLVGGWYLLNHKTAYAPTQNTTSTSTSTAATSTSSSAPVAQVGERCGGNMRNAPVCAQGSHCAPTPGSHLPFGDVGGTCVADSASAYVAGNLLLGTDSNATLGKYLIADNGMTLYTYGKDSANVSNCSGQCAANWPPYTVASVNALANIQAGVSGKVGTITRTDGSLQVTYNSKPLYFYVKDTKSGDTTGQGVGGVWYVVKP